MTLLDKLKEKWNNLITKVLFSYDMGYDIGYEWKKKRDKKKKNAN